jgi:hypothetical protein
MYATGKAVGLLPGVGLHVHEADSCVNLIKLGPIVSTAQLQPHRAASYKV